MGLVTADTVACRRRVDAPMGHGQLELRVTVEAQVGRPRQQETRKSGLVGIVAGGAIASQRRRVFRVVRGHGAFNIGVARHAQRPDLVRRQAFDIARVRVVAREAHPFDKRHVTGATINRFHHVRVTRVTEF